MPSQRPNRLRFPISRWKRGKLSLPPGFESSDAILESEDPALVVLLADWQRLQSNLQQYLSRILTTTGLAAAALGVVIANLDKIEASRAAPGIYFALPVVYTVIFALIIEHIWLSSFEGLQVRRLEYEIAHRTGTHQWFVSNWLTGHGFYGVGAPKSRIALGAVALLAILAIYLGLVYYAANGLEPLVSDRVLYLAYATDAVFGGLCLYAFFSMLLDTRNAFLKAVALIPDGRPFTTPGFRFPLIGMLRLALVPRLADFLGKSQSYALAFMGSVGLSISDGDAISFGHHALVVALVPWLFVELGVNQSKLVFNDIGDRFNDAVHSKKRVRLFARRENLDSDFACFVGALVASLRVAALGGALLPLLYAASRAVFWVTVVCAVLTIILQLGYQSIYLRFGSLRVGVVAAGHVLRIVPAFAAAQVVVSVPNDRLALWATYITVAIVLFQFSALTQIFSTEIGSGDSERRMPSEGTVIAGRVFGFVAGGLFGLAGWVIYPFGNFGSLAGPIAATVVAAVVLGTTAVAMLLERKSGGPVALTDDPDRAANVRRRRSPASLLAAPLLLGALPPMAGLVALGWMLLGSEWVLSTWVVCLAVYGSAFSAFWMRAGIDDIWFTIPLKEIWAALRGFASSRLRLGHHKFPLTSTVRNLLTVVGDETREGRGWLVDRAGTIYEDSGRSVLQMVFDDLPPTLTVPDKGVLDVVARLTPEDAALGKEEIETRLLEGLCAEPQQVLVRSDT